MTRFLTRLAHLCISNFLETLVLTVANFMTIIASVTFAIFATTTYHAEYFSHDLSCQLYCFVAAPPTPTTTTTTQAVGNRGYAGTSASMSCSETGRQTDKTTPNAELHQLQGRYSIVLLFLVLTSTRRGLTLQFDIGFTNLRLYLLQMAIPLIGIS